ncbi:MAG: discoidin domain-containing protein [Oscillospiraceae bacterium]
MQDGRFTAEMAVDGDMSTRVSFGYDDYQYFKIDLGKTYALNQVKIYFGELPNKYEVYVAEVDEEDAYVKVYSDLECPGGTSRTDTIDFAPVSARYVKYVQLENYLHAGLGDHYSGNFFEIEVYGADIEQMRQRIDEAQALYDSTPAAQVDAEARQALAEQIAAANAMLESMDFNKETFDRQLQALAFAVKRFEEAINPIPGPAIWGAPENGVTRASGVRLMADKTVTWTVNGVQLERKGANLLLSTEGSYEVYATGDDGGVSETLRFAIDRTGPALSSEQVETNGSTNQDVVLRADEDVRFELDGTAIEGYSRELTVTEPGRHVVRAYDRAGNRSSAFVVTIVKTPPILSTNFYILNGVTRYNVAVTADRRVDYYVNGELVAENEYRCKFLEPGVYEVKAIDAAGNESKTLKFEIRR